MRRYGQDVGVFPEIEEAIPDERCVCSTATFMYRVHGKQEITRVAVLFMLRNWSNCKERNGMHL